MGYSICKAKNIDNENGTYEGKTLIPDEIYTIPDTERHDWAGSEEVHNAVHNGKLEIHDASGLVEGTHLYQLTYLRNLFLKQFSAGNDTLDQFIAFIGDRLKTEAKIVGNDGVHNADVILDEGVRKLATVSTVTVNELLGVLVNPSTYFSITAAPLDSTFQVLIPDDSVDKIITVTASEADDSHVTAEKIVEELNEDTNFKAIYKAFKPKGCPRVFIQTLLAGTCNNRSEAGDFDVQVTGGASVSIAYDVIIQRGLPTALFPHPDDPTKGTFSVTGSMSVIAQSVEDYFSAKGVNGSSSAMNIDGSGTPVEFIIEANSEHDIVITEIRLSIEDGGVVFTKFMDVTSLTNGLKLQITTNNRLATFSPLMKTTNDIVLLFNSGGLDTFIHLGKRFVGTFKPDNPFILFKGSSDRICFIVQDDLRGLVGMEYSVKGYKI